MVAWLADVQNKKSHRQPSALANMTATIPSPVPALHQPTLRCSRNASQEQPSIRPGGVHALPARHTSRNAPFLSKTFRQPGSTCWFNGATYLADRAASLSHPDAAGFPEHCAQQETLQRTITDPGMSTSSKWALFNEGADQSEDVVASQHLEHGAGAASSWSMGLVREQGGYDDMPVTFAI